ncbi:helicase HerA domain-containing protein [Actinomadura hibisca]|uniref:helicase HerA domain-containing protein n=1 Tax=Actinomadura hibisca TaxID=68565 RepID=UPI00082A6257|nr:DUF87 domain-containing protein [Actinomadura hibisca]
MDALTDVVRAFLRGLRAMYSAFEDVGLAWLLWLVFLAFALAFGTWRIRRHMNAQVSLANQVVGAKTSRAADGATLFRSSLSVEQRPSLSPFDGRPVILRGLPYPVAVLLCWLWVEARPVSVALLAGTSVYVGQAVLRWWFVRRHTKTIVRPLSKALAPILNERPQVIYRDMIVPAEHAEPDAEVVIPLPDDHHPTVIPEVSRIVHARLGGERRHSLSKGAPYLLTFTHKPSPPTFVAFEDVAEFMLHGFGEARGLWQPFLGLGTEQERMYLNFDGAVVHLGISAGTGAGKSTLMRILAAQFAVRSNGTARQAYIDPKGDYEGMEQVPGMKVYNDIGDIDSLDGIYKMWDVVGWYKRELDARRKGERGPKEGWEPLILFNDEQNAFGKFSRQAWEAIREKSDPKIPPVWQDMYLLGVMGRSFKIRMINAYQVMSAQATGGGNAQDGSELRRQFGNKLLARFDPSMWDSLVGTRPRGQSSDVPGRWLHVGNAGLARSVQLPIFEPEHVAELCSAAGLDLSPVAVSNGTTDASHEAGGSSGDTKTGDKPSPQDGPPSFPWDTTGFSHDSYELRAANAERNPAPEPPKVRYTLEEAIDAGIISVTISKAKQDRTRARKRGTWYPEPEFRGRAETYTHEDLTRFYSEAQQSQGSEQDHTK